MFFEVALALVTLTVMEVVLGIDNIIFIAVVSTRLPADQQSKARRLGLVVALVTRLLLLFTLTYLMTAGTTPLFHLSSLGIPVDRLFELFGQAQEVDGSTLRHIKEMNEVTLRDVILFVGGLFLIAKATHEIHNRIEEHDEATAAGAAVASFGWVLFQIALLDIVFSLDSVITAIGMARELWIMVTAVIIAVGVMLAFANPISDFVSRHPTVKMLALAFLILIGVMLVADSLGQHIPKGYIYFAMAFSVAVELLNLQVRKQHPSAPTSPASEASRSVPS